MPEAAATIDPIESTRNHSVWILILASTTHCNIFYYSGTGPIQQCTLDNAIKYAVVGDSPRAISTRTSRSYAFKASKRDGVVGVVDICDNSWNQRYYLPMHPYKDCFCLNVIVIIEVMGIVTLPEN
ncbi:hypothetical protein Y032_0023g845 [Ancylostoma ceylanicum]|uniref:Uncharacterized protein n=1 Tax=Ancylostoma ceylanicum TaxID=53326 RepID=A0A016V030_9BILA|nr:hypothetical protein Y032_0023g845 [Ancylostoma ceylanicum]